MQQLLDLVLPPRCPGCGREGAVICDACAAHIRRRIGEPFGVPIGLPSRQPAGIVQIEWCCAFNGPARAAVHALKYEGELRLVKPLAEVMAARWRAAAIGGDLLAFVPVHVAKRRQRGFDQAELLARAIGRMLKMPVAPAVQRASRTAAQHKLGRQARATNVGGAFVVSDANRARVRGKWIVLIDDVVTTGATLSGCAAALYEVGAAAVSALTFARER